MSSPRSPLRLVVTLLVTLTFLGLVPQPSNADSQFPPATGPFTLTVTSGSTVYTYTSTGTFPNTTGPTIPVEDGTPLTVEVSGDTFARLQARQCKGGVPINNSADFNPDFFNLCTSATLGDGEPLGFRDSGPVAPGTTSIEIPFAVGAGTAPELESQITGEINPGFTCGVGNNCQLVVRVEVSAGVGSSNFLSFPLSFDPPPSRSRRADRRHRHRRQRQRRGVVDGTRIERWRPDHRLHRDRGTGRRHLHHRHPRLHGRRAHQRRRLHVHRDRDQQRRHRPGVGSFGGGHPDRATGELVHAPRSGAHPRLAIGLAGRPLLDAVGRPDRPATSPSPAWPGCPPTPKPSS